MSFYKKRYSEREKVYISSRTLVDSDVPGVGRTAQGVVLDFPFFAVWRKRCTFAQTTHKE